jgi:uncharacterized protein (DUF1015 family)
MEQCKTLGEETYFLFSYCPDNLVLVYGFSKSKQKLKILKDEFIYKVICRMQFLVEQDKLNNTNNYRKLSFYNDPKWMEAGVDRILSPYVAKLVLDVFPNEILEKIINQKKTSLL